MAGVARPTLTYQGLTYITNLSSPLFIHQYSHAWFDFPHQQDVHAQLLQQLDHCYASHKLFCLSLASHFSDYSDQPVGITGVGPL